MTKRNDQGFTLIELALVVTILGIIAAIAIPIYHGYVNSAEKVAAQAETRQEMLDREWHDMIEYTDGSNPTINPSPSIIPNPDPITGLRPCHEPGRVTGPKGKKKCHMPGSEKDYYLDPIND